MRDQLSLRLEPELAPLPNLPDGLRPMLSRPFAEPADLPGAGDVRIVDGEGRDVGAALPELAGMAVRLDARSAVLDGELVAVDAAGRADPEELARRIAGGRGRPVAFL